MIRRWTLGWMLVLLSNFAAHASEAVSKQFEPSQKERNTFSFEGTTLQIRSHPDKKNIEVQVTAPNGKVAKFVEVDPSGYGATIQFAKLDPNTVHPQILVSTFSGGAHCCFGTTVLTFDGKKWVRVPGGRGADGAAPEAKDIDGDGRAEIAEPDGVFLYAFASYAASIRPVRIYQLDGLKWKDVSRNPSFRKFHSFDQADVAKACDNNFKKESQVNGFWAGYVASEALAGRRELAWKKMLQCYDKESNWGLCEVHASDCEKRVREFPETLKEFLKENGYW